VPLDDGHRTAFRENGGDGEANHAGADDGYFNFGLGAGERHRWSTNSA